MQYSLACHVIFLAPLGLGTAYSPTGHAAEPVFQHYMVLQVLEFVISNLPVLDFGNSRPPGVGFWSFQASGYRILEFPGFRMLDFSISRHQGMGL